MKASDIPGLLVAILLLFSSSAFAAGSCVTGTCHSSIAAFKNLHHPVREGECLSCHTPVGKTHPAPGEKGFALSAPGADLCYRCHERFGKEVTHQPVREGECLSCHRPHGSAGRYLLEKSDDLASLCFGCHDDANFRLPVVHGPAASGSCTQCHSPHHADRKSLLREEPRELCMRCHSDFARQMKEAPVVHSPVKKSPCESCHVPHGSEAKYLLREKMPKLCLGCHPKIAKVLSGAKHQHPPVEGEGGCGNCHSSHFSNSKGLLPFDERRLCLGCHGAEAPAGMKNLEKELKEGKELHGPLRENDCSPCHNPHGSDDVLLLRGAYPREPYQPYREGIYDFCLSCHDKYLLRFKDTTIYTNFRNGNQNLHYVHVVNSRKGRSCRFCHAPHASDGPKLVDKSGSPFGEWKIPIRLDLTPTGGSCAPGCHTPLRYDRKMPVEYLKPKK